MSSLMPTECPAVNPPSTARAWPVTNEASSEAKKAATAAISSGRPKRPSEPEGQRPDLRAGQRPVVAHPLGQGRADDQLGRQPGTVGLGVGTEEPLHPGVLHPLGGLDLPGEAGASRGVVQGALGEELDRHLHAVGRGGGPHLTHAAARQATDEGVRAGVRQGP